MDTASRIMKLALVLNKIKIHKIFKKHSKSSFRIVFLLSTDLLLTSGLVVGACLSTGFPSLSTINFEKFHLIKLREFQKHK